MTKDFRLPLIALTWIATPTAAAAQNAQAPALVTGLENFDIAAPQARPTPLATPTPRATSVPVPRPSTAPVARATTAAEAPAIPPAARPTPAPELPAVRSGTSATDPVAGASDAPAAASNGAPSALIDVDPGLPAPRATPQPGVSQAAQPVSESTLPAISPLMLAIGAAILAIGGMMFYLFWLRPRRAPDESFEIDIVDVADENVSAAADLPDVSRPRHDPIPDDLPFANGAPLPAAPPTSAFPPAPPLATTTPTPAPFFIKDASPATGPRAQLEFTVRPQRAGTNLTSAAVDYEIDIHNNGELGATGIRLDLRLLSASADQDAILDALYRAPIDRPAVAPFDVAAGEQVSLGGMAMLPREALSILTVQGRDFFVPLLSLNVLYGWGTAARGQTASAYVIGIERPDDAKMAPFRLDIGPRMFDGVGQREHHFRVVR